MKKAGVGRVREEKKKEQRRENQKKEDPSAQTGVKVVKHNVFLLAKAAVRGHQGRWEMKDCTPLWREARFELKSENNMKVYRPLKCLKRAPGCGVKHGSKSKCIKHTNPGPPLEVEMWKKCMPLWREAQFQVKMYKAHQSRSTFGCWDDGKMRTSVLRSTFQVKVL